MKGRDFSSSTQTPTQLGKHALLPILGELLHSFGKSFKAMAKIVRILRIVACAGARLAFAAQPNGVNKLWYAVVLRG